MQAVILSGGEGSRLRPLTQTVPKPIVPLVNRPIVQYMIDWLVDYDIKDIIMSVGFLADGLRAALGEGDVGGGVTLRYVEEPKPLGTGGAIKFAERLLDDRFLVLNGDIMAHFDLREQIAQHEQSGAVATLALVSVEDATTYGLVLTNNDKSVEEFLEKPSADQVPADPLISAGAYVIERSVVEKMPQEQVWSFELDVFPTLIGDGLYGYEASGYWIDVGTPARYLQATFDVLNGDMPSHWNDDLGTERKLLASDLESCGASLHPPVIIDDGCVLRPGVNVEMSVLGHGCQVGAGSTITRSVVQRGCEIGERVVVDGSILASGVIVGDDTQIERGSVIGEGARIGAHNVITNESRISAGAEIPDDMMRS